ncbi:MAG: SDR family NAD(P)-dependent oxidoreductase, partial [Porticoccaceae bacterium]|nr:SDR family NAD(P)-dependent oxidoreductase [Porticoccaceae bacterium]
VFLRLKLSGFRCADTNYMSYSKSMAQLEPSDMDFSDIESLENIEFAQSADPSYVKDLYPGLFAGYGCSLVSQISYLSSVVGMQAPGLHSIFVSATLNLKKKNNVQSIEVIKTDQRFSLVDLRVNTADMEAKLRAIVRPMPIESLSLTALNKKITKRFAAGKRVLVIGGSRGLGSYTVKILALMGAAVTFSYARGVRDAERLKKELEDTDINVNFVHFDVSEPNFCKLFDSEPDYVFYFATPKIFVKRSKVFEQELYGKFKLFYVDTFETILEKCASGSAKGVFYPSSVAVVDETKALPEYIQAKLEGESLCKEYDNRDDLTVLVSRLPRTLTDQTATHLTIESEAPFDVLMPIFEELL